MPGWDWPILVQTEADTDYPINCSDFYLGKGVSWFSTEILRRSAWTRRGEFSATQNGGWKKRAKEES